MRELLVHEFSSVSGGVGELHVAIAMVGIGATSTGYIAGGLVLGKLDPVGAVTSMVMGGVVSFAVDCHYHSNLGFFAVFRGYDIAPRAFYAASIGAITGLGGSYVYADPLSDATNTCVQHCVQRCQF